MSDPFIVRFDPPQHTSAKQIGTATPSIDPSSSPPHNSTPVTPAMEVDPAPFHGHGSGVDAMTPIPTDRSGRRDGRAHNEMRPITLLHAPLSQADGSARVKLGGTDVLVAVFGPLEAHSARQDSENLSIAVTYRRRIAPTTSAASSHRTADPAASYPSSASVSAADSTATSATSPSSATTPVFAVTADSVPVDEAVQSRNVRALVADVLLSALFPRKALSVAVQVLSDRGGVVSAACNAAVLALLDAGIPMSCVPVAANVSCSRAALTVDPTFVEECEAECNITCVFDTLRIGDNGFLSVCTEGDCGGQPVFAAAVDTCRQLAIKTKAFLTLSLEQRANRKSVWKVMLSGKRGE